MQNVEPIASDVPPTAASDALRLADDAAADAEAAADDAEVAADDAELAADDAELAADDARESLRAVQSSVDACAAPTPVDCGDGMCASSIYACDADDAVVDRSGVTDETGASDEEPIDDQRSAAKSALDEEGDGLEDAEGCATSAPGAASAAWASAVAIGFIALAASRLRRRTGKRPSQSPHARVAGRRR